MVRDECFLHMKIEMLIIFDFGKISIHKQLSKLVSGLLLYELMNQSVPSSLELHLCLYRHTPKETDQRVYEYRSSSHERLAMTMTQASTIYT